MLYRSSKVPCVMSLTILLSVVLQGLVFLCVISHQCLGSYQRLRRYSSTSERGKVMTEIRVMIMEEVESEDMTEIRMMIRRM